jgi:hypothetical protein
MSVSLQFSILAAVKHALQNFRRFEEEEEEDTGEGGKAGNRKRKNM